METTKYRFNEARHIHQLWNEEKKEYENLTGCTTILSILAKPALIQWSANMTSQYIEEEVRKIAKENDGLEYLKKLGEEWARILIEAKSAHRKKKEKAGEAGTDVHALIEDYIKKCVADFEGRSVDIETNGHKQVRHFVDWARKNKVKFLESEKHIYSKTHWLGGIVDIVCEIDGQIFIADIKTGSGIYPEHFAQMAGYEIMLDEMGFDKITGHIVLNLKKDGSFQEKRSVSTKDAKDFFLACVQVYRLQEKFKNQVIN